MKTTTITASITYPTENINTFADRLGYPTVVANPDYTPAQGSEQIVDPAWEQPENFNPITDTTPMVDNPNFVPANGEPTMPNPESREDFVKRLFKAHSVAWFTQFIERDIARQKEAEKQAAIGEAKSQIEAAITI